MPPPPPPPPAPPPGFGQSSANSKAADKPVNRGALLSDIRSGAKLKKTVTNDRSAPAIGGKAATGGGTNEAAGDRSCGGGGHSTAASAPAAGFGKMDLSQQIALKASRLRSVSSDPPSSNGPVRGAPPAHNALPSAGNSSAAKSYVPPPPPQNTKPSMAQRNSGSGYSSVTPRPFCPPQTQQQQQQPSLRPAVSARPAPTPAVSGYSQQRPAPTSSVSGYSQQRPASTSSVPGYSQQRPAPTSSGPGYSQQRPAPAPSGPGYSQQRPVATSSGPGYSQQRPAPMSSGPGYGHQRPASTSSTQGDAQQRPPVTNRPLLSGSSRAPSEDVRPPYSQAGGRSDIGHPREPVRSPDSGYSPSPQGWSRSQPQPAVQALDRRPARMPRSPSYGNVMPDSGAQLQRAPQPVRPSSHIYSVPPPPPPPQSKPVSDRRFSYQSGPTPYPGGLTGQAPPLPPNKPHAPAIPAAKPQAPQVPPALPSRQRPPSLSTSSNSSSHSYQQANSLNYTPSPGPPSPFGNEYSNGSVSTGSGPPVLRRQLSSSTTALSRPPPPPPPRTGRVAPPLPPSRPVPRPPSEPAFASNMALSPTGIGLESRYSFRPMSMLPQPEPLTFTGQKRYPSQRSVHRQAQMMNDHHRSMAPPPPARPPR